MSLSKSYPEANEEADRPFSAGTQLLCSALDEMQKRFTLSYSLGELNPLQYQTAYQNITGIRKILLRIHQNQSADTDW